MHTQPDPIETHSTVDVARREVLLPETASAIAVMGVNDENAHAFEAAFPGVTLFLRDRVVEVQGEPQSVTAAVGALEKVIAQAAKKTQVSLDEVLFFIGQTSSQTDFSTTAIVTYKGRSVQPRNKTQAEYVAQIDEHAVVFGLGPAGTGKTYLAVAKAIQALLSNQVSRILLTRPAVEAGENLGFLPGTLDQKIDPYLRPLHDALHDMLAPDRIARLFETGAVEIAPLAFMRGRTLNDAFVILDEAQNTTSEQMRMFLTRLGFGSTMVITGDETQVDLPRGKVSGLDTAIRVLEKVPGIGFTRFTSEDVVRHSLVSDIVDAYARWDNRDDH